MRFIICDDDHNMLYLLTNWIKEYMKGQVYQILTYDNGVNLLYDIEHDDGQEMIIVFMDIKLKNDNGIDIAKELKKRNEVIATIFISGYTEYVEDTFAADPIYFLVKPLKRDSFDLAMKKALEKAEKHERRYILLKRKEIMRIFVGDIIYAESAGRKIHLYYGKEKVEYYEKMDHLEKAVGEGFIRCHKSYLVNMKYVRSVGPKELLLLDGRDIPVSRTKLSETKEKVFEYLGRQLKCWE